MTKKTVKKRFISPKVFAVDMLFYVAGSLIYAFAINFFTAPNAIAAGGITGISTLLNHMLGTPIGVMIILLNVPLFIWSLVRFGWTFLMRTVIATVVMSLTIDITAGFLPHYSGDTMLAALFGGVLSGLGLAIVFLRGATTGGSDLIAKLINARFPHFSMGNVILAVDMVVITSAGLVYRNIENALFSLVMIFVSSILIDRVLYGTGGSSGKMMLIMSPKNDVIVREILEKIERGATLLKSKGAYSGNEGEVILCAVRRHEIHAIKEIIKRVDPDAFTIIGASGEITGEGFRSLNDDE